jgi:hypothetical protein
MSTYDRRPGSPFDRGDSDAYYRRPFRPHYWADANGYKVVTQDDMTDEEIEAYASGYEQNPSGEKDYGYE